jgi:hypothetical protein
MEKSSLARQNVLLGALIIQKLFTWVMLTVGLFVIISSSKQTKALTVKTFIQGLLGVKENHYEIQSW